MALFDDETEDRMSAMARQTTVACITSKFADTGAGDARMVLTGYLEDCFALGADPCVAWSKLSSSAMAMSANLLIKLADANGISVESQLAELGALVADT